MNSSDTSRPNQEPFPENFQESANDCGDYLEIKDEGHAHKYFTTIPNIIFELDLSAIEFVLYCHLKRVCGESGRCWMGIRGLEEATGMSSGSVRNARDGLLAAKLIRVKKGNAKKGHSDIITIVDIWKENMNLPGHQMHRSGKQKPVLPDAQTWAPDAHKNNSLNKNQEEEENSSSATLQKNPASGYAQAGKGRDSYATLKSPRIDAPPTTFTLTVDSPSVTLQEVGHEAQAKDAQRTSGQLTLQGPMITNDIKPTKPLKKKKPIGFLPPSSPASTAPIKELWSALEELCRIEARTYSQTRFMKELKVILRVEPSVEQIDQFKRWWYKVDFRGLRDQPPTMSNVALLWRQAREYFERKPKTLTKRELDPALKALYSRQEVR